MQGVVLSWTGIVAAACLGRVVLHLLKIRFRTREGMWGASFAIGYVLLGCAFLAAGLLGSFTPTTLLLLLGVAGLAGLAYQAFARPESGATWAIFRILRQSRLTGWCVVAVALTIVVPTFLRSLLPPTEGDALCYHIELPARFLKLGAVEFLPWTDQSLFPLLADLWYAIPLCGGQPAGPGCISFAVFLSLVGAVVELGFMWGGTRVAMWALLVVVAAPVVANHAAVPFSDLPVAMLAAWSTVYAADACRGSIRMNDGLLLGVTLGGAAASKLTGLVWAVSLSAVVIVGIVRAWRKAGRARDSATAWVDRRTCAADSVAPLVGSEGNELARFEANHPGRLSGKPPAPLAIKCLSFGVAVAMALAATAAPWYVRAWLHTGNPLHPFLASVWPGAERLYDWRPPKSPPVPVRPLPLLSLAWKVTLEPERFGGRGHQWGVAFLALLPAVVLTPPGKRGSVLGAVVCYSIFWAVTRQNLRFLLPVMPVLAVCGGRLVEVVRQRGPLPVYAAAIAILLLHGGIGVAAAARRCPALDRLPLTSQRIVCFLRTHEPTYRLAESMRRVLPPEAVVLTPEHRLFYFSGVVVREDALRRWLGYEVAGSDFLELCRYLGITHVLLVRSYSPEVAVYDESLAERLRPACVELVPVLRQVFRGPNGDHRVYELFSVVPGKARLPATGHCDTERARELATRLRQYRDRILARGSWN